MLQLAVVAGGTAAALVGLLGLARRLRIRRMLNQLPVYTLGPNAAGITVSITPVGASITRLSVPGAGGAPLDIVLGYERAASYALANAPYLGAIVGRCANRIAKGRFALDGREYRLAVNNGPNALHGGPGGFHCRVWETKREPLPGGGGRVACTYRSRAGEEGYPGAVTAAVTYELPGDLPELRVTMRATADAATPVNLAQHSYFNLRGHAAGDVLDHVVTIAADAYTPVDADLIPTGELAPVQGTPFDFRAPRAIGERIGELENGYDHNFVLRGGGAADEPRLAADVSCPASGVRMQVLTTAPGMQFYTGGFLGGALPAVKGGAQYGRFGGFALETQGFPNAVNTPAFPPVVLRPRGTYKHDMVYRFPSPSGKQ